jgi:hypothetical protein
MQSYINWKVISVSFRYGVSLRGLRPNDFSCGFISIEMAKIIVGLPSLTQPLLLYPGMTDCLYMQKDMVIIILSPNHFQIIRAFVRSSLLIDLMT